jgi:SAM-dependent MidA family methyltransferase
MSPLEDLIRAEIRQRGPIPFARFMDLALYHPEHGYYCRPRDPFGVSGDYYTNSQLQPLFGRLIAQQILAWRKELGNPADFTVVEMGAGRAETLDEVSNALFDATCLAVDRLHGSLPEKFRGVVYSNEFFDALPVHLVERRGDSIVEHFVDLAGEEFCWTAAKPSDERLDEYIRLYAPNLAAGQKIEVNLDALIQLETLAAALEHGYVLTIDYGYTAPEIAEAKRFADGSLMSYEKHQARPDVLAEPGERDLTAHVNFTALEQRGRELGLQSLGLTTQAQLLLAIGEADHFEAALTASDGRESLQRRMQLKSLLFGMGETFRVLIQKK